VDLNVVMTGAGEFIELQGTGEESTFSRSQLDAMLTCGRAGVQQLFQAQKAVLTAAGNAA